MKKGLLRFAALLAALMIQSTALAQEYYRLPEVREQAAQGWHETYTDLYGRRITVDAEVEVYGADAAPVLYAQLAQNKLNSALLAPHAQWNDGQNTGIYHNNPADVIFKTKRGERTMTVHQSYCEKVDMDAVYMALYGASITMREMTAYLSGVLMDHGIDVTAYFFDRPKEFTVRCRLNRDTMAATEPAAYFAHIWQNMHGFPILTHINEAYRKPSGPTYIPQLVLSMRSDEEYSIYLTALQETQMLSEDIPLCGFEQIKRRIEEEIVSGHIRKVFGVRLGYIVYNELESLTGNKSVYEAKGYYLAPMWMVDCIYMDNAKKEYAAKAPGSDELTANEHTSTSHRMLLMNAQTGEMLNYHDGSRDGRGDSVYPGFLSWAEVMP